MHPNHKFDEDQFSQTSSTSLVGGQITNSESFDPLVELQAQLNALKAAFDAYVATHP